MSRWPKSFATLLTRASTASGGRLVGLVGAGVDALRLQFGDDGVRLVGRGDIADRDVSAVVGEGAGGRRTDAARTAGDEGNLA